MVNFCCFFVAAELLVVEVLVVVEDLGFGLLLVVELLDVVELLLVVELFLDCSFGAGFPFSDFPFPADDDVVFFGVSFLVILSFGLFFPFGLEAGDLGNVARSEESYDLTIAWMCLVRRGRRAFILSEQ